MPLDVDAIFAALELVVPILVILKQMNNRAVKAHDDNIDITAR